MAGPLDSLVPYDPANSFSVVPSGPFEADTHRDQRSVSAGLLLSVGCHGPAVSASARDSSASGAAQIQPHARAQFLGSRGSQALQHLDSGFAYRDGLIDHVNGTRHKPAFDS